MKIAIVSNDYLHDNIDSFIQAANSRFGSIEIRIWNCHDNKNIFLELTTYRPSIIVTENLAGFHMGTYMDNAAYNLIPSIQLHIIYDPTPFSQNYSAILSKPLSLLMHFWCCSNSKREEILSLNPDVPYINVLPSPSPNISFILDIIKCLVE